MTKGGFVKKYLRIDEVAQMFDVTPRTVRNWWLSGSTCLQAWKGPVGDRGVRFTIDSVKRFEETGFVTPEEVENA